MQINITVTVLFAVVYVKNVNDRYHICVIQFTFASEVFTFDVKETLFISQQGITKGITERTNSFFKKQQFFRVNENNNVTMALIFN